MNAVNIPYAPATKLGPAANSYSLPAFSLAHTWTGVSQLIEARNLANTSLFALALPIVATGNFGLVIKWVDADGTHRYKLYDDGIVSLTYDIYAGETIGLSAQLEIWSASDTTPATMSADLVLPTSILTEPSCAQSYCTAAGAVTTSI
jgi:hypothetical protein